MTVQQLLAFAIIAGMMAMLVWGASCVYDLVALLTLLAAVVVGIGPYDKEFLGLLRRYHHHRRLSPPRECRGGALRGNRARAALLRSTKNGRFDVPRLPN